MQTTPPQPPARRPHRRRSAGALSLALSVGLLAGSCSALLPDDGRESAEAFAAALSSGGLGQLELGGAEGPAAQEEYERITAGLGRATPSVAVTAVEETAEEERREATLSWTWDLAGTEQDWSYDATLSLVRGDGGQWVPRWSPDLVHPALEEGEALRARGVDADRGDVLGAGGEVLVTERPVRRLGVDRSLLEGTDPGAAARALAAVVELDPAAYAAAVEQAGPEAFVEAITLRQEDFTALDAGRLEAVPGLRVVEDELPLAPSRDFAPGVLGSVSEATAEDLESGELAAGSMVGRGGVQERFDDRLRGTPGVVVEEVPAEAAGASPAEPLFEVAPEDGRPVELTLDRDLQATAQELLAGFDSPSSIVAIRPSTGELVVAADGPGSEGYPTGLLGQYAPGSTFKVITSLGMLRKGDTPATTVPCPPSITVEGVRFANVESYPAEFTGSIPLTDALAHSCNTTFIGQHDRISQAELAEAAAALGIGVETDLGVPSFTGSLPEEEDPVQHAAAMFGQGRTLVSPLAMANATASVVAGRLVAPSVVATEGLLDDGATAGPAGAKPVTGPEAEQLRTMMRAVVTSGHLADLQGLQPDTALGKTGTAEYGTEDPPRTHSWIVAAHEDLAVAVFVEDGDLGSVTGGPVARDFLAAASRTG
ncbi:penicillin-binding transpeptidase domain-containing protein [Kocuria sp. M1R5S2]|uniref:penicillin-binding transpeptidase domain-containing protein n=1 Tax=Kocuria rhizosphaerae TaxID=3376285 RepID=UPI00379EAE3B